VSRCRLWPGEGPRYPYERLREAKQLLLKAETVLHRAAQARSEAALPEMLDHVQAAINDMIREWINPAIQLAYERVERSERSV